MPMPIHLWTLVRTKVHERGISEREAGRRIGMSTREWSYYLKTPRDDITPHSILEKFSRLEIPLLDLERAALEDDRWQIITIVDTPDTWQIGIEHPPSEDTP